MIGHSEERGEAAVGRARQALAAGNFDSACNILEMALIKDPNSAVLLNMRGNIALRLESFEEAVSFFERAVAVDPAPPILLNLSIAACGKGDVAGELHAIERALMADPYFQLGLLQRARWYLRHGGRPAAAADFSRWLATIPSDQTHGAEMGRAIAEAKAVIQTDSAALFETIQSEVGGDMPTDGRLAECINLLLGRKRRFHSKPSGLYIPFLPETPFFDRALFPWFDTLEQGTDAIRNELLTVLSQDAGFEPYVAFQSTQPVNQWAALNHSRDWSAFFLIRNGERVEDNCARCPDTMRLLKTLPLLDLEGRGPTVIFSILKPGTRIPPHSGITNSRAVVHLPLIVPDRCGFRVGATIKEWREGQAWAFDDTIEHEAWNDSGNARAILIIDAWNPYLSKSDRDNVRALTRALERHAGRDEWAL